MTTGAARVVDRSKLPVPGPSRPFTFQGITRSTTPNGLSVWTVRHAAVPVVTFTLLFRRGSAADPPGQEGLAALTLDMLDEGSAGRSAIEFHEALAQIGAQVDSDISSDAALISLTAMSRFADRGLGLMADMVARPLLTAEDFVRVRALRLHRLVQLRDMPGAVADRAFTALLYGDHPYGHTPLGVERTLSALAVDDVRGFHQKAIRPSEATLIAVGDCEHDQVVRLAEDLFAGWNGATTIPAPVATRLPQPPRLNVVPRAGAPQSELRVGHVAVARDTPDYYALVATNMVLGGQFVSRINLNLREEKGFTYGARTSFDFRKLPGPFLLQVSVHTHATATAIEEAFKEIEGIRGSRRVTPDELSLAVAALTRGYARNFETADQIARAVSQIALYDLPDDYFVHFVPHIERVTTDDVTHAAWSHLDPAKLTTLIVGDMDVVGPELPRLGMGDAVTVAPDAF